MSKIIKRVEDFSNSSESMNHRFNNNNIKIANNHYDIGGFGGFTTRIQWGHDLSIDPVTGISSLGEVLGETHNTITLGGKLYMLERIFGVKSDKTSIPYLNDFLFDDNENFPASNLQKPLDGGYSPGHRICLFNVGIGGCGSAYTDVYEVKTQHRIVPGMIPFRVESSMLEGDEANKYAFVRRVENDNGVFYEYYLKRLDKEPTIHALWDNAGDNKDGDIVENEAYLNNRDDQIKVFAEMVLTISPNDLRQYFEVYDGLSGDIGPEHARFNTFGLCAGAPIETSFQGNSIIEYGQVLQETILTFGNELLHMDKDLSYIYRIYK